MKEVKGDLVEMAVNGYFDVIIHGCNCLCTMGAGIAGQIKQVFPKAYSADKLTKCGDRSKLGTWSKADIILYIKGKKGYDIGNLTVINAYTQYNFGTQDMPPVDYGAIRSVFTLLNDELQGKKIGIPMIGCGLAGGDWEIVSKIIQETTPNLDITVVEYNKY